MTRHPSPAPAQAMEHDVARAGVVSPNDSYRSGVPEPWERPALRDLGRILREARETAGLSLDELGPVAGNPKSLHHIERGRRRTRASRLRPWASRVGLDPDALVGRFAAVIAPERADGRPSFSPVSVPDGPAPRPEPPRLLPHERAALGAELWRLRLAAGLSRPALANELGCDRVHVLDVERAHRRPSAELLEDWLALTGSELDRAWIQTRFPGQVGPRRRRRRGQRAPGLTRGRTDGSCGGLIQSAEVVSRG